MLSVTYISKHMHNENEPNLHPPLSLSLSLSLTQLVTALCVLFSIKVSSSFKEMLWSDKKKEKKEKKRDMCGL